MYSVTSTDEISRIVKKLMPVVAGEPLAAATGAMLTVIIASLKPDVTEDELIPALTDISGYINATINTAPVVH